MSVTRTLSVQSNGLIRLFIRFNGKLVCFNNITSIDLCPGLESNVVKQELYFTFHDRPLTYKNIVKNEIKNLKTRRGRLHFRKFIF